MERVRTGEFKSMFVRASWHGTTLARVWQQQKQTHSRAMSDVFADLLGAAVGGSGSSSTKQNDSNLSLNDRISAKRGQPPSKNNSGLDLDFLDTYVDTMPAQTSGNQNGKAVSDFDIDLFSDMSKSKLEKEHVPQVPTNTSSASDLNLLDDFFGQPVPPRTSAKASPQPAQPKQPKQHHNQEQSKPAQSVQELRDLALAELIDMGFPIDKANEALDSTQNGHDLDGAISYLMNSAHSQSGHQSSISPPASRSSRRQSSSIGRASHEQSDDFGKIVNDLSSEFMSTASFLFNSSKKKIQQGVEMYRHQRLESNDGQPLWMRNQHIYKEKSMKLPGEGEEEEMDRETMRRLTEAQKQRERKLKEAKDNDLLSLGDDTISPPRPAPTPVERMRQKPASSEMYVSSSRHRRRTESPSVSSTPTSNSNSNSTTTTTTMPKTTSSTSVPSLLETQDVDLLGGSFNTSPEKHGLHIPPLSSAQDMSYRDSKKMAQEKFKNGDFSSALEHYLQASSDIPLDHPYQIILSSNLTLVYSKLGNPKEQLVHADRGLDLITKLTPGCSISSLSRMIIEEGKSVKSFWIKLTLKRAEALEFSEKWKDAKSAYEKLIAEGESSKVVMDGKNRCVKVLSPKTPEQPKKERSYTARRATTPKLQQKSASATKTTFNPDSNEKLQRIKQSNQKKLKEDEEKFNLHDRVEEKLDRWRHGNKDNIRALLCSLDNVLWPELNWKPVKLTDLVLDKKVKIFYMKAVAKTHPDKISSSESTENRMIANGVFITLNEAWESFKVTSGI